MEDSRIAEFIECDCGCLEHVMRLVSFSSEHTKEIFVSVVLRSHSDSFFMKLKAAFKYLFNKDCMYGNSDEWIFGEEEQRKITEFFNRTQKRAKSFEGEGFVKR